jgi:2-amino-4-hydroxy-6-hydroxymethyldihydropteridine diphosphokinase
MTRGGVYIGVGSNIDPENNILSACALLKENAGLTGISVFYRTEPVGNRNQPRFYNGVVGIRTALTPESLKRDVLRAIESSLGRVRTGDRNAPRTIDLDILLFGDLVIRSGTLVIPDPYIEVRPFVGVPLYELAGDIALPGSGRRLKEIAGSAPKEGLEPLMDFTKRLRERMLS